MCLYYIHKFLWNPSIPFWDSPRSSAAQSAPSVLQSYPVTAHRWRGIMMSADVSSVVCLGRVGSLKRRNVAIPTVFCLVCCRVSVSYPYSVPIHPSSIFFHIVFYSASAGWKMVEAQPFSKPLGGKVQISLTATTSDVWEIEDLKLCKCTSSFHS